MKNFTKDMKTALEILFLKHNEIQNKHKEINKIKHLSFFCFDKCFNEEILKLTEYYKIDLKCENPFTNNVITRLEDESFIEISDFSNTKGSIKITTLGIEKLLNIYQVSNLSDDEIVEIILNELNNISNTALENNQKRNKFLLDVYKISLNQCPSQPLSWKVDIKEIKNFSIEESKRIIQELVTLKYATSGLGYSFISLTMLGMQNIDYNLHEEIQNDSVKENLDYFHIKPNIFGLGLNGNKIIETIIKFFKKRKKSNIETS